MKKVFTIALGMAFLLLCGIPAMAQVVAGTPGSYTYDPYTGEFNLYWSTAGGTINSHNQTANGPSYSSGQTVWSRYSNPCRTEVIEEVNCAASDVEVYGTSALFLEALSESAYTQVGTDWPFRAFP